MLQSIHQAEGRVHLFGTLQISSKAHQQVMGDGVHQVEESRIFVEHFIEECSFQSQVLQEKESVRSAGFLGAITMTCFETRKQIG